MNNYFAFIDESGILDESKNVQPFFAVGFLKILDTSIISEKLTQKHYDYFSIQKEKRKQFLQDLRDNPKMFTAEDLNLLLVSTRHYEYKFTNITFTTLERYKSFLDTAWEFPLHFCALIIDKTDPLFNSTIYKNYWRAYIKYAKLLCEKNCANEESLCVIADYMNKPRGEVMYFERELNSLQVVFNTLRSHSETFTLLQICDLMLWAVVFQWRQKNGFVKDSNRAKAKKDFIDHLVNKLVIPSNKRSEYPLAQAITCNRPIYLSVWPLQLSQTKNGSV